MLVSLQVDAMHRIDTAMWPCHEVRERSPKMRPKRMPDLALFGCLIWLYLATNSGFKAWYLLSVFWQKMDQIHALYLWIDEVVAGLTEIATIGSFSFWMATLAASKFENCGNCLTCSAAVHETTGRGVGRRRRGRSAESEPLSTWTNNRSSKLEFTHTTGCLNNPCSTNYYLFPPCLVWVQHNAFQQRFWGGVYIVNYM